MGWAYEAAGRTIYCVTVCILQFISYIWVFFWPLNSVHAREKNKRKVNPGGDSATFWRLNGWIFMSHLNSVSPRQSPLSRSLAQSIVVRQEICRRAFFFYNGWPKSSQSDMRSGLRSNLKRLKWSKLKYHSLLRIVLIWKSNWHSQL